MTGGENANLSSPRSADQRLTHPRSNDALTATAEVDSRGWPSFSIVQIDSWADRHFTYIVSVVFVAALLLGLRMVHDYGVTYDEATQRTYGRLVYEYVFDGKTELLTYPDRFYGPLFEFVLYGAERLLKLQDIHAIFQLRHTLTFLCFFAGSLCFYGIARRLSNNRWSGLLGVIFLFLSPRIVADAFYNSKDIPFLVAFIVAIWSLLVFRERQTIATLLVHALACAAVTDIRLLGALVPVFSLGFLLMDFIDERGNRRRTTFARLLIFPLMVGVFVATLWPTLWRNPPLQFSIAVSQAMHYPWPGIVFFFGKYFRAEALPRYYLPVWMLITTPVLYVVLGIDGVISSIRSVVGRSPDGWRDISALLPLIWFFVPVILVTIFRPTLYDGWRHLYFVYPAWLLFVLREIREIHVFVKALQKRWQMLGRCVIIGVLLVSLGSTVSFMVRNHPFQNLFFSSLIGGIQGAEGRFELDYWGPSYKQAIEQVLRQDRQPVITASFHNFPGELNARTLTKDLRERVEIAPLAQAQYFFTNFRDQYLQRPPYPEVAAVTVDGVKILSVYQLH